MKTNGLSAPRIAIRRGFSNRSVIWLATEAPRMVPMRKTVCASCGWATAVFGQHFLDQPLVPRVGEGLVAAHRVGFGQPGRIVGVVAVGGAAGGDNDVPHAGRDAGLQHVARAVDIDAVFEGAVAVAPRRDDRGQVNHGIDRVPAQRAIQPQCAHIGGEIDDARAAAVRPAFRARRRRARSRFCPSSRRAASAATSCRPR